MGLPQSATSLLRGLAQRHVATKPCPLLLVPLFSLANACLSPVSFSYLPYVLKAVPVSAIAAYSPLTCLCSECATLCKKRHYTSAQPRDG